jgi:hypothetical protein
LFMVGGAMRIRDAFAIQPGLVRIGIIAHLPY